MFKDKRFRVKTYEEIEQLISEAMTYYPEAQRIFLADGDALTVDTAVLVKVLDKLYQNFPRLKKVGIYGGPKDILRKSIEELKELKEHGLNIVYLGVESGSARILKAVHKGVTPEEMIAAGKKVMAGGLLLSCTVIIGLGGKAHSREHAIETAKVASAINPHYLAGLTLLIEPDAPIMRSIKSGELEILSPLECLSEIRTLVEHLEVTDCIFRCNHASNYLPLKATLPAETTNLLKVIDDVLKRNQTERLRPENWRAL
jgi:radical SAM superfamily enzyme YgiQ (UPF0313 family)